MISRGERGSRIGNPAISATVLSMLALRLATAAGEVSRGARGAVAMFSVRAQASNAFRMASYTERLLAAASRSAKATVSLERSIIPAD
ncbi:MAG: hypothetical protein WAV18_16520 [Roseiarcus sp.]